MINTNILENKKKAQVFCQILGQDILLIWNKNVMFHYVVESFVPASTLNPSYEVVGKEISLELDQHLDKNPSAKIVDEVLLRTKLEKYITERIDFSRDFTYIWVRRVSTY